MGICRTAFGQIFSKLILITLFATLVACAGNSSPNGGGVTAPVGAGGAAVGPAYDIGAAGPGPGQPTDKDCYVLIRDTIKVTDNTINVEIQAANKEGMPPSYPPAGRVLLVMDRFQTRSLETQLVADGAGAKASFSVEFTPELLQANELATPEEYAERFNYYLSLDANAVAKYPDTWVKWASEFDYLPDGMLWLFGTCEDD